jgi:hypothetical protein
MVRANRTEFGQHYVYLSPSYIWKVNVFLMTAADSFPNMEDVEGGLYILKDYYLFSLLLSRLSPYVDEIIGDHQCGFRRNRSTTDQIICIRQILEKKWSTVRQYISYS